MLVDLENFVSLYALPFILIIVLASFLCFLGNKDGDDPVKLDKTAAGLTPELESQRDEAVEPELDLQPWSRDELLLEPLVAESAGFTALAVKPIITTVKPPIDPPNPTMEEPVVVGLGMNKPVAVPVVAELGMNKPAVTPVVVELGVNKSVAVPVVAELGMNKPAVAAVVVAELDMKSVAEPVVVELTASSVIDEPVITELIWEQPESVAPVILVVDDSAVVRITLSKLLQAAGFHVHLACDGVEALELLAHTPVDLVLTDLEMPNMDGIELIAAIQASSAMENLPIVAISGNDELQARVQDIQGLYGIFSKPWNDRLLVKRLEALVNLKKWA